jgi:two-component sensor histidine kinase
MPISNGRVLIEGRTEGVNGEGSLSLLWSESGGPPVSKPTRKGFGSFILLDAAKQLGQSVTLDYDPHGLRYELKLPLRAIEAAKKAGGAEAPSAPKIA